MSLTFEKLFTMFNEVNSCTFKCVSDIAFQMSIGQYVLFCSVEKTGMMSKPICYHKLLSIGNRVCHDTYIGWAQNLLSATTVD